MLENKDIPKTPIAQLGEFKLIDELTKNFSPKHSNTSLAIGDDAALIDIGEKYMVISTDMLTEGVHFNLGYNSLKHLGYKSIIVNLSDILAMNATPKQVLVSIAVSNRFPVEALQEIYQGIEIACNNYKVDLIGGDTTSSQAGLIISITAIGEVPKNKAVQRTGAKPNDLLVVTGDIGAAYMGLQILERENIAFKANPHLQPDIASYQYLLQRQLKPEARIDIIKYFLENNIIPTSMIDISDGLSSEVKHLSKKSKLGFHLYEEKIPLDPLTISTAEEFNIAPTIAALNGGEDYELLFTIDIKDHDKISKNPDFTIIGHATEENSPCFLVPTGNQQIIELKAQGWDGLS